MHRVGSSECNVCSDVENQLVNHLGTFPSPLPRSRNSMHLLKVLKLTDYDNIFKRHVLDRLRTVIEIEAQIFHNNSWNGRAVSRKTRPISLSYFATLCPLKRRRSSYALARFIFKTSINCTWFVFICGRIIIFLSYFMHNFLFILFVQLRRFFRITKFNVG